jgi:hypothetical protein
MFFWFAGTVKIRKWAMKYDKLATCLSYYRLLKHLCAVLSFYHVVLQGSTNPGPLVAMVE